MPEAKARELADASDLIVNDYAFVRGEAGVRRAWGQTPKF